MAVVDLASLPNKTIGTLAGSDQLLLNTGGAPADVTVDVLTEYVEDAMQPALDALGVAAAAGTTAAGVVASDLAALEGDLGSAAAGKGDAMVATAAAPGGLWTTVRGFIAALLGPSGSSLVGYMPAGAGAAATDVETAIRGVGFFVERFGAIGNGVFDCTNAVLNAISAMRGNPVSILSDIGGSMITAYSSGTLNFGPGVFVISADALSITQELGLTLKGRGSRRTNNAVRAATTLLISGTSSGFGIKVADNGARGFHVEDMDVCYATSGFTGNLIDTINAPGMTLNRAFLGTFGLTGGTRLQTATSLIRSTYDEFLTVTNCVLDGAIDGWWSDDLRIQNANTFGGSVTKFDSCVFYDFSNRPIRHDGLRTRQRVVISNTVINPISVDCVRGIDLTNIDGLSIIGGGFAGSVGNKASAEWLRLANCTGVVKGVFFDDLSKAGTIDGMLDISGNRVFCTDGLTLKGGVITGKSNEFSKGTAGYTLSPTYALSVDIGPDLFKSSVTNSYKIAADSTSLEGRINYSAGNDASTAKFTNASSRIRVINTDEKAFSIAATPYTVLITDTGRTIQATGAANQVFTLPVSVPGTRLSFNKIGGFTLTITCAGGNNFYTGAGVAKTSVLAAAIDIGGTLVLEAYATVGWRVVSQVGNWTYS